MEFVIGLGLVCATIATVSKISSTKAVQLEQAHQTTRQVKINALVSLAEAEALTVEIQKLIDRV
jgi:hypothetical protein